MTIAENSSHTTTNGYSSNNSTSVSNRKQFSIPNQTKFAILIATPKIHNSNGSLCSIEQPTVSTDQIKSETVSPHPVDVNNKRLHIKNEQIENNTNDSDNEGDEALLSRLISYLVE